MISSSSRLNPLKLSSPEDDVRTDLFTSFLSGTSFLPLFASRGNRSDPMRRRFNVLLSPNRSLYVGVAIVFRFCILQCECKVGHDRLYVGVGACSSFRLYCVDSNSGAFKRFCGSQSILLRASFYRLPFILQQRQPVGCVYCVRTRTSESIVQLSSDRGRHFMSALQKHFCGSLEYRCYLSKWIFLVRMFL